MEWHRRAMPVDFRRACTHKNFPPMIAMKFFIKKVDFMSIGAQTRPGESSKGQRLKKNIA